MQDGSLVKFSKMAEEHPDADVGDLYVVLRQEPHDTFTRNGSDLYTDFTLTLQEALLGFKMDLKHLDGRLVTISRSDSVVQPDSVQQLSGEGMPLAGNPNRRGDLYIKFKVVFPQKLDKNQHTLLAQALRSSIKEEL
jgi:DnaJ-class molecular chaperone